MENGNLELRAELRRLTAPPDGAGLAWLNVQIQEMEKLNERLPHSVRLHTQFSPEIGEANCFMFALGIEPDSVRDMCLGNVFPGKSFMQFLLRKRHLDERDILERPVDDDIVVYLQGGVPEHAGKQRVDKVISKWGSGGTHIWEHALWDIPAEYGTEARCFAPLTTAVEIYRAWAASHGL
jgi:hypothetical protein